MWKITILVLLCYTDALVVALFAAAATKTTEENSLIDAADDGSFSTCDSRKKMTKKTSSTPPSRTAAKTTVLSTSVVSTKLKTTSVVRKTQRTNHNNQGTNDQRREEQQQGCLEEITKLCDSVPFPDNVQSMVRNFVDFTMNNYKTYTEPISMLKAFQLSLATASELSSEATANEDFSTLPSMTGVKDRVVTNADALSRQIPVISTVNQNPAVEQPASNLEVGSHSRQVVPLVSNMVIESLVPGGVRAQLSETRNPGLRNRPIEATPQSPARNLPRLYHNPLSNELERIEKMKSMAKFKFEKQNEELRLKYVELHKSFKKSIEGRLTLKWDYENRIKELQRLYGIEWYKIAIEFKKARESYDAQYKIVRAHKILGDAMNAKSELEFSGAPQMLQDSGLTQQQLHQQHSRQQNLISVSSPSGNRQAGPEIRAPALHGMPIHLAPSNSPARSMPLGVSRVGTHTGQEHENTRHAFDLELRL